MPSLETQFHLREIWDSYLIAFKTEIRLYRRFGWTSYVHIQIQLHTKVLTSHIRIGWQLSNDSNRLMSCLHTAKHNLLKCWRPVDRESLEMRIISPKRIELELIDFFPPLDWWMVCWYNFLSDVSKAWSEKGGNDGNNFPPSKSYI